MATKPEEITRIELRDDGFYGSHYCAVRGSIDSESEDPDLEEKTIVFTRQKVQKKDGKIYVTYLVEELQE